MEYRPIWLNPPLHLQKTAESKGASIIFIWGDLHRNAGPVEQNTWIMNTVMNNFGPIHSYDCHVYYHIFMTLMLTKLYYITFYVKPLLVGGWPTPLKKYEFVSWDEIPNIWKVIKLHGSKPPARYRSFFFHIYTCTFLIIDVAKKQRIYQLIDPVNFATGSKLSLSLVLIHPKRIWWF